MKLALHSDLHLEGFRPPSGFLEDKGYDVLVLAGDIVSSKTLGRLETIRQYEPNKPIIYVPGNHEYYGGSIEGTNKALVKLCDQLGIHFMPRGEVVIDDVVFIGATGWSNLEAFPEYEHTRKVYECSYINDFRLVDEFSISKMLTLSRQDKLWIKARLVGRSDKKKVVITHFAPTIYHGSDRFCVSPISAYFSNDWVDVIKEFEPDAWLYGHTHGWSERSVPGAKTSFYTNQRGYGSENSAYYDPSRIIEV